MVKLFLRSLWLIGLLWAGTGLRVQAAELIHQASHPEPTAAYKWLDILLETSAREVDRVGARPTILARSMAIVETAMYDAWAAYDAKAIGTRFGDKLRRPEKERTQKNKETAIAYAAYRSLLDLYGGDDKDWVREQMKKMGYDPDNNSMDRTKPEGIGNVAAAAVIEYRRHDGSNQHGDEAGSNGKPYSDYTYYRSVNKPNDVQNPTYWMPIPFVGKDGKTFAPNFLTAHWYRVKPFALERADQFRSPPPPEWGSKQLAKEVEECAEVNANLSLEQKAIVEFMRDGPRSTGQSGHWLRFAQDVSRRDKNDLDRDVKMFFAVANVVHDTFVSSWDTKRYYDTSRPYWWVRQHFPNKHILGWKGPGKGVGKIPGKEWHPYSPSIFVTPPFPGYVSGHATASAGAARTLELFTGSDKFGAVAIRKAGELTEDAYPTSQMQARNGKPAKDVPESKEIRLPLPTFKATAEMAAMSRLWGGYHIRTDNNEGLIMGKKIADYSWPKYQAYFEGKTAALAH
ncbi:vanadium-dependent haloperoxidase [Oligoflexus tunisiensis]|uniref:vanadium-dependent haloperoxidase n=1 Tax=Oligoflexus tunisiensis TaxID=708132 RepID=UPI00114C9927|nr:vanadium-dependent haloperoxidase [Oligoflexus tunisiensis]